MLKLIALLALCLTACLNADINVLAFAGSTRADSVNKKLINEAAGFAHDFGATVTVIDLKDLPMPLYDGDLEDSQGMPENAQRLQQLFIQNQVIIIASPEYNRSIPAVLKNALDWISRSLTAEESLEAYQGKKFLIMSASPGKKGGAKGLIHLRDILEDLNGIVPPKQFSLPAADLAFDADGKLVDPAMRTALQSFVQEELKN